MRSTLESLLRISRTKGDNLPQFRLPSCWRIWSSFTGRISGALDRVPAECFTGPAEGDVQCAAVAAGGAALPAVFDSAVESQGPASVKEEPKTIRLEATCEGSLVQILVAHSGPGFLNPERAFDPLYTRRRPERLRGWG